MELLWVEGKKMVYSSHYQIRRVLSLLDSTMMRLCFHWFPEGVPLSGSGLEEALPLPFLAMAVSESCWSGVFLKHPTPDASGICPSAITAPKGQLSWFKKHLKKSTLLLWLLLSPQNSRLEMEAISSLQTFLKILKHFVMENSNVYKVKRTYSSPKLDNYQPRTNLVSPIPHPLDYCE